MKETQGRTPLDKLIDAVCEGLGEESGFVLGLEACDKLTKLSEVLNLEDSDDSPYFVPLMAKLASNDKIEELNNIINTADKLIDLIKEGCLVALKSDKEEDK